MIKLIFFILFSFCSAKNNFFFGIGQYYSRIRIFEYVDYSDVTFFKFNIYAPTTLANWSVIINADGKCSNYLVNIHFNLQYGAYPLIAPKNESFPDMYITTRHDLISKVFNRTISNTTVQLTNPLRGTWFAMAFVERLSENTKSKFSSSNCNISLTTWLDYQAVPVLLTLTINQPFQVVLSNNITSIYASYYTLTGNSRITVLSEWHSECDVIILARINGLPNSVQYDYQTVCKNDSCLIEIDELAAFIWIYFQISVKNLSCLNNSINGSMIVYSTECLSHSNNNNGNCIQSYPTQRVMFINYYDFKYIPEYSNSSINTIIFNENDSSIYSYEFIVDDRNIGGTIHFEFQTQIISDIPSNVNVGILGCLSKNLAYRYHTCEIDYKISIDKNSRTFRSLPYPEMGLWYLTLEYICNGSKNECANASISLTFQVLSTKCTQEQCGTYGGCQILISQQNIFSTCSCVAGYRGYGCTDSRFNHVSKYLPSVLFLTLSNLMFIPAIAIAIYYRLYIEALVYFFNMFFSTFYHACDQEIRRFCIFKYDGLQLSDFVGSYSSFVITLITMSIISRSIKVFLFMLGLLACVALTSRDRFNNLQLLILMVIIFSFTMLTWIIGSIKKRRLQPTCKNLLFVIPGVLFAITGIILFVFVETDDNYWYIHSLWHIFMATSILFFLPHKIRENERRRQSNEQNTNTSDPLVGVVNEGAVVLNDEIENRPTLIF